MPYRLILEFPKLPSLNPSARVSRWVQIAEKRLWLKRMEDAVCFPGCTYQAPPSPLEKARVNFIRRSTREPDADNLAYSFKHIQDALVRCWILEDDSPSHLDAIYRWEKAPRGSGGVRIEVEELVEASPTHGDQLA